jgi:hypothetical protein
VLTKREGETYDQFIQHVLKNKLVEKIKKADIEDNMNLLRLSDLSDKD